MDYGIGSVWCSRGYAEEGLGYVSFLAGSVWSSSEHSHLEGSAALFNVAFLEERNLEVSRIVNGLFLILSYFSFNLCLIGS